MKHTTLRRGRTLLLVAVTLLVAFAGSAAAARAITGQDAGTPTGGLRYVTQTVAVDEISRATGTARCPAGTNAIDGGVSSDSARFTRVVASAADTDGSGWRVELWNLHPSQTLTAHVWAECLAIG